MLGVKTSSSSSRVWNIGLDPWILKEGTYFEFRSKSETAFAVEFYSFLGLTKCAPSASSRYLKPEATFVEDSQYRVRAQVCFVGEDYWVINCGILAYCEAVVGDSLRVGDWVEGDVILSVDPFFYFQYASKDKGAPALVYDWTLDAVQEVLTPLTEQRDDAGRTFFHPDTSRARRGVVPKTALKGERATSIETPTRLDYVLQCRVLKGPRMPAIAGLRP